MKKSLLMIIVATAFLAACGKSAEEVHTVDWFKQPENNQVLTDTVQACKNDPGTLGKTPNCINATEAYVQLELAKIDQAIYEDRQALGNKK
ncbi:MAG: EexN family lipoprotein [Neisseriaceae bacterium]|nr:EexN family lipoprotein [Neisseriaceae bacterium]